MRIRKKIDGISNEILPLFSFYNVTINRLVERDIKKDAYILHGHVSTSVQVAHHIFL